MELLDTRGITQLQHSKCDFIWLKTQALNPEESEGRTHLFRVLAARSVECFKHRVGLSFWSLLVSHTQFAAEGQGYGSAEEKIKVQPKIEQRFLILQHC